MTEVRITTSIRIDREGKKRVKILAATYDIASAEVYEKVISHVWSLSKEEQHKIFKNNKC